MQPMVQHAHQASGGGIAAALSLILLLAPIIGQRSDENLLMAFRAIAASEGLRGMC
jgi:hypothetical protein